MSKRRRAAKNVEKRNELSSLPTLKKAELPQGNWTVGDSASVHDLMVTWLDSIHGERSLNKLTQPEGPEDEILKLLGGPRTIRESLLESMKSDHPTVVHLDASFVDMMEAASLSAQHRNVNAEDLLAEQGAMYLSRTVHLEGADSDIRALYWTKSVNPSSRGESIRQTLAVIALSEVPPDQRRRIFNLWGRPYHVPYLRPVARVLLPFSGDPTARITSEASRLSATSAQLMGLMVSLAAISRSPLSESEGGPVPSDGTSRGHSSTRSSIRRSYLRHPEYGSMEIQAARGKMRAHWVRGHWRRQWYSSIQEHRFIWVDGFPKGNPDRGEVKGSKILVARGDDS